MALPAGVQINAPVSAEYATILTPEAMALVAKLHRAFEPRRQELLKARIARQARIDAGEMPDFLPSRCLGWDIAITSAGPVLIEANRYWDPHSEDVVEMRRTLCYLRAESNKLDSFSANSGQQAHEPATPTSGK